MPHAVQLPLQQLELSGRKQQRPILPNSEMEDVGRTHDVPTPRGKPRSQPGRGGLHRSGGFQRFLLTAGSMWQWLPGCFHENECIPKNFSILELTQGPGPRRDIPAGWAHSWLSWEGREKTEQKNLQNPSASTAGGQIPPPSTPPRLHFKEVTLKEIQIPLKKWKC